jgi:outer membrane protein assembly factor BamB
MPCRFCLPGLLVAVVLCLAQPLGAQEWTRFRGPNGSGISSAKTIPSKWTEKDINWKVELPAGGHSSPVLWGDKIFLAGADNDSTAERTAFCVDAKNGKVLWSRKYPSTHHKRHKLNSFASATPAVDRDYVYFVWSAPEEYTLLALDHSGREIWRRDLGPFVSQHSCGTSPIVYEDLVILGNEQDLEGGGESFLIAVDRRTGETAWKTPRKSAVVAYSTPCLYKPAGGPVEVIFNSQAHGMMAVDPRTGNVDWEVPGILDKRSVSSPVITASGLITASCGSGGGGNYLVAVKPATATNPDSGTAAYKIDKGGPYVPTPLAKGDFVFLWSDAGIVTCAREKTGEIVWQKRVGGTYYGSPICVDDRLFCTNTDGEVVVVSATAEFEELARNPLGEVSHSTPAVAGGRMYVRTLNHLVSVGGK